jgi:hypothetical protein
VLLRALALVVDMDLPKDLLRQSGTLNAANFDSVGYENVEQTTSGGSADLRVGIPTGS